RLAVHGDVVDRRPLAVRAPDRDRREPERLEVAGEGAVELVAEPVRVDGGEEADLAVVDREHRRAGARVLAQGREDSAVAAEDDAEGGALERADLDVLAGDQGVLLGLV